MKRTISLVVALAAALTGGILAGCGDAPSTPIAPDQPKPPPGPPADIDQMMKGARERGQHAPGAATAGTPSNP